MRKMNLTAAILSVLCAAALTACGTETIQNSAIEETTVATTDTTKETSTTTEATTTAEVTTTEADTTSAEETADTTTSEEAETETTTVEATEAPAEVQTTEAPAAEQTEAPQTEPPAEEKHLLDELKIGGSCADYIAKNTNYEMRESDSCLVNGKDRVYTYPDFILRTVVENGNERIVELEFTSGNVSTRNGIHVGSTEAEVVAAFGAAADGEYCYETEDGTFEFLMENGVVQSIYIY